MNLGDRFVEMKIYIISMALTALTIMVAESNPEHKEKVVKLILNLIARK